MGSSVSLLKALPTPRAPPPSEGRRKLAFAAVLASAMRNYLVFLSVFGRKTVLLPPAARGMAQKAGGGTVAVLHFCDEHCDFGVQMLGLVSHGLHDIDFRHWH
jgi:hypothetical protein